MNANGSASVDVPEGTNGAEDELVRVLDAYLAAVDAGRPPDPEWLIAAHPTIADRLRDCLGVLGLAEHLAGDPESDRTPESAAAPDARIGDFRILRQIGRGGMGVVYEAEQISLRRRVALKVMPFAATLDPKQLQRFQLEAHAAACLHHTNIVPVHAVGIERGVPYYAMQFIEGQNLAEVIRDLRQLEGLASADGPEPGLVGVSTSTLAAELLTGHFAARLALPAADTPTVDLNPRTIPSPLAGDGQGEGAGSPGASAGASRGPRSSTRTRDYIRNVARLGLQAAEALDHAHTRGILHRDIKPANLLLDPDGCLWIADFGLAQIQGNIGLTLTGDLLGTLRYMSPEQALGKRVVLDGRTDVYSLGATLYELLTLRPAFDGKDRQEILRRIADEEPATLRTLNPAVPHDLGTIIAKAMDKEPGARYATVRDLAEDLRSYLENRPIQARRPSLADRAGKWSRRHRPLVASAAMTVLAVALMLAGSIGYVVRDRAARLTQTGQRVAEALAGARTAIEASDLTLANQRVAEAQAHLGTERERLPNVATTIRHIQQEIDARQADEARLQQFLKLASDAQLNFDHAFNDGTRLAREALGLYGVVEADDWLTRLEKSSLTGNEKDDIREEAYVLLILLADHLVRWPATREDPQSILSSLDLLRRARAFHEPTRAFYFVRSVAHSRRGNEAAADEDGKRYKVMPGQTAWDYYLPGHSAGWAGDLEESMSSYRAALAVQPNHYNSLFFLAARLRAVNRTPEALQLFTGCIALRPDFIMGYTSRSLCYMDLGQWDEAVADCREVIRLRPDHEAGHSLLGAALGRKSQDLGRKSQLDEAIASIREALRLNPDLANAHNSLGIALHDKGQLDEAIACFREALRLNPDFAVAHRNLGLVLQGKGQLDEAIAQFQEAIRIKPDDGWAHNNLAWLLAICPDPRFRDPARAVELARTAVELAPTEGGIWNTLGIAEYRAGRWDESIEALTRSMELTSGGSPADWFFLALAHERRGEQAQARSWYDKAVSWMEQNRSEDEELLRFRTEAEERFEVNRPSTEAPAEAPR